MMITKWRYFDDDGIPTFYNSGIETTADNVVDALNAIENQFADLQVHIDALRARAEKAEAMVERLIEAGDNHIHMAIASIRQQDKYYALVDEWKASKDGGGE